ncbi:Stp1/IreP family PP2C-type Ser/Thr phosphatase [Clostridium sp. MSJ-11]|uniref:Stp1/IreP family PP2C-type Ser/Thr phosphatase n=1 Tax=Clostridium mobile TaxID=2841512 RepID=A0ABS6EC10_9CLOT|nr:Stp1/IreP family PP2C-type Ser/Thr phosphatase [Clostridium mobile]MBU5482730.1 Stp1/IreP family PP2C-type Ser/Thr phosphatase [Clostridium mobile]
MVGILSDIGNYRSVNEDSVGHFKNDNFAIYIVADGMGGHNAGEIASKLAVDSIIDSLKKLDSIEDGGKLLESSIEHANSLIYKHSREKSNLSGMGTTITACLVYGDEMVIGNVGDSRCYIINKENNIIKITKDHSLVQQLLDDGSITEEEAVVHPNKNIITRALGTNPSILVDIFVINLKDIRKVLLCTDGLTNDVTPNQIYDIIMKNNCCDASKLLVELSKEKGGRDNISVIVFEGECKDDRYFTGK